MPSSTPTRWCPTPEQLMMLEELYRRGLKTPNSSQIQRITAHLSLYGKIQGKNVFYWFQNHKARDRQKLRKKLANQLHQPHPQLLHHNHLYQYYQLPPPTHHSPSPFPCFSTQNQGREEVMRQTRRAEDLPKDGLMKSCGHDSVMIIEAGPTFPCCRRKPLQTLELFPLSSPSFSL